MPREAVELSLNEQNFILQALREGERLDGRRLDAYRSLELSFGEEYGLADVRLGKTRYATVTSAESKTDDFKGWLLAFPPRSRHLSLNDSWRASSKSVRSYHQWQVPLSRLAGNLIEIPKCSSSG